MKNQPKQITKLPVIHRRPGASKYKRISGDVVWEGRVYEFEGPVQIGSRPTGIKRLTREEAVQDAIDKMEGK